MLASTQMAGESILVVEDAPESLKQTANALRSAGYRVSIASTAEQAWSSLRTSQPQLVLVDFILPGMSGLQLTSKIKQDARLRNTLVVALTACDLPGDEARARQVGCDGYLIKPIESRALIARVRNYLDYGKDAPGAYAPVGVAPEPPASEGIKGVPADELAELRDSFLKGGKGVSRQL